jgi:hypothetical protein
MVMLAARPGSDHLTSIFVEPQRAPEHARLARCNTYLREVYGEMRDELNVSLPSDRFQVVVGPGVCPAIEQARFASSGPAHCSPRA